MAPIPIGFRRCAARLSLSLPNPPRSRQPNRPERNLIMKAAIKTLFFLGSITATFAYAQSNNIPQIQHVIIVIQENRTPTNLFFADQTLVNNGAHVQGPNNSGAGACKAGGVVSQVPLQGFNLGKFCWDPDPQPPAALSILGQPVRQWGRGRGLHQLCQMQELPWRHRDFVPL